MDSTGNRKIMREYFDTLVKERAAFLVADGATSGPSGEREYPASVEAAEDLERANMMVDALNTAYCMLLDAPASLFGGATDRHEIAAGLHVASEHAARQSREAWGRAGLSPRVAD
jgi:hypothetical protein